MDWSPFMTPTVFVTIGLAAIAFIVWLVRLEAKNSGTKEAITKLEKEIEKLELQLKVHETDRTIHFDSKITEQADKLIDHRLKTMEKGIEDIQRKLNHLSGRE